MAASEAVLAVFQIRLTGSGGEDRGASAEPGVPPQLDKSGWKPLSA